MSKGVVKFIARLIGGLIIGISTGVILDKKLNTSPWIMICLIVYVVFGSLFILVKDEEKRKWVKKKYTKKLFSMVCLVL